MKKLILILFSSLFILVGEKINASSYSDNFLKLLNSDLKFETNSIYFDSKEENMILLKSDAFKFEIISRNDMFDYYLEFDNCNEDVSICDLTLISYEDSAFNETHQIELVYNSDNLEIKNFTENYVTSMENDLDVYKNYEISDLELVSLWLEPNYGPTPFTVLNYASKINQLQEQFEDSKYSFYFIDKYGMDLGALTDLVGGELLIKYDGVNYEYTSEFEFTRKNVVYIPSNTLDTNEGYINAAEKRIFDELGVEVEISSYKTRADYCLPSSGGEVPNCDWSVLGDESLMGNYIYGIENNGITYNFVIMKDSSQLDQEDIIYSETFDKLLNDNGHFEVRSLPFKDLMDVDVFLYGVTINNLPNLGLDGYQIYFDCNSDYSYCDINLSKRINDELVYEEQHNIKLIYGEADFDISLLVEKYLEKIKNDFESTDYGMAKLYTLSNYNLLNYWNSLIDEEDISNYNNAINYISSIKKDFEYSNFSFSLDTRAGSDEPLKEHFFGNFVIYYNGIGYDYLEGIGIQKNNVVYIPTDTENTKEAYSLAASKIISEYLGKDLIVSAVDLRSNLDVSEFLSYDPNYEYDWSTLGDESLMGDYYYSVVINGITHEFVIIRDSSKIEAESYISKDNKNDVSVKTDAIIPFDTLISVEKILNNDFYKEILKKNSVYTYDISLFSKSTNSKITKLDNGLFSVTIPIPLEFVGKNLIVEFVNSNNEVELHEVFINGNYATFFTNHFSVYSLSELFLIDDDNSDIEAEETVKPGDSNSDVEPEETVNPDDSNTDVEPEETVNPDDSNSDVEPEGTVKPEDNNSDVEPEETVKPEDNNSDVEIDGSTEENSGIFIFGIISVIMVVIIIFRFLIIKK